MIQILELILIIFAFVFMCFAIFFNVVKIKLWEYINDKMQEQKEYEKRKIDMKNKKGR